MAKLIYSAITSLDGYTADADGNFGWSAPDEEVHTFVNELERPIGTYLYGRGMYEVMAVWDDREWVAAEPPVVQDFSDIWRAAQKIVYSTTLESASTGRTRTERSFDPDAVRRLKESADRDLSIGGATLAGAALKAGLVDELLLLVSPVVVGGGTRALPSGLRLQLELVSERRFSNGVVHLHYRMAT